MKKSILVSLIVVAFVCALGLGACAPKPSEPTEQPTAPKTDTGAEKPAPAPAEAPQQPAEAPKAETPEQPAEAPKAEPPEQPAEAPKAEESAQAADPIEGVALSIETLPGTKWKYQAFEFDFEPDGALKVNGAIPGTWKLDSNKLTVGAMGQEYTVEVQGNKLVFNGEELEKIK